MYLFHVTSPTFPTETPQGIFSHSLLTFQPSLQLSYLFIYLFIYLFFNFSSPKHSQTFSLDQSKPHLSLRPLPFTSNVALILFFAFPPIQTHFGKPAGETKIIAMCAREKEQADWSKKATHISR